MVVVYQVLELSDRQEEVISPFFWGFISTVDISVLATYLYGREREQPWHTKHPAKRTAKGSA